MAKLHRVGLVTPRITHRDLAEEFFLDLDPEVAAVHGAADPTIFYEKGELEYENWLKEVERRRERESGECEVRTQTYFLMEEVPNRSARNILPTQRILGMVEVRSELNQELWNYGGHIAYSLTKEAYTASFAQRLHEVMFFLAMRACRSESILMALVSCPQPEFPEVAEVARRALRELGATEIFRNKKARTEGGHPVTKYVLDTLFVTDELAEKYNLATFKER